MRRLRSDHVVHWRLLLPLLLAGLLLGPGAGSGDAAEPVTRLAPRTAPHAGYVFPAGGRAGTRFRVSVGGQRLRSANAVHVTGEGVTGSVQLWFPPARPLDGATLYAYAELERRIDATEPEWDIRLTPPLLALPGVTFEAGSEGENGEPADPPFVPDTQGRRALSLIAWAQARTGVPLRVTGPEDAVAVVRTVLSTHNIAVQEEWTGTGYGRVSVRWATGD